jgi:transcriptional antiterminator NusG
MDGHPETRDRSLEPQADMAANDKEQEHCPVPPTPPSEAHQPEQDSMNMPLDSAEEAERRAVQSGAEDAPVPAPGETPPPANTGRPANTGDDEAEDTSVREELSDHQAARDAGLIEEEVTGDAVEETAAEEATPETDEEARMEWYILKVQSNRENSICDGLLRRVAVAGLQEYFGEVLVPTEDVAEFKNGKRRVVKRKLYPGYIVVHMVINDDTWFLVRETPGIGDFTGSAGNPTPMLPHEVERIVKSAKPDEEGGEPIKTAIPFKDGDRVRIKEGTFENFEGDVEGIDEANGRVTVMINIFGRSTPVELEHWQIENV